MPDQNFKLLINNKLNLSLLAKQVVEGFVTGLHKSPFHGYSVEFVEHQIYNQGDNIKNIDWKLYAKTDKLFTKKYEQETNLRCQFVLDVSSSMYFPNEEFNKLMFSAQSIAVLLEILKKQRDAFALSLFEENIIFSSDTKSTVAHQKYLLNHLEQLLDKTKLNVKTHLPSALHQIAEQVHKRSLVVIFSDFIQTSVGKEYFEELSLALQHLKFNKHEVILFDTLDYSKEIELDYDNKPYEFVDLETGKTIKIHSSEVKELYKSNIINYKNDFYNKCKQYKIDVVEADINKGFKQILETYLIKRQQMRT